MQDTKPSLWYLGLIDIPPAVHVDWVLYEVPYAYKGVEIRTSHFDLNFMKCDGPIEWHTDPKFDKYSTFLCIENGGSSIHTKSNPNGFFPERGDVFTVNIHEEHCVKCDPHTAMSFAYFDSSRRPGKKRALEYFQKQIKESLDA